MKFAVFVALGAAIGVAEGDRNEPARHCRCNRRGSWCWPQRGLGSQAQVMQQRAAFTSSGQRRSVAASGLTRDDPLCRTLGVSIAPLCESRPNVPRATTQLRASPRPSCSQTSRLNVEELTLL